jgi:hypothetical protein
MKMELLLTKNAGLDIEPLSGFSLGSAITYPAFHAGLFTLNTYRGFRITHNGLKKQQSYSVSLKF